MIELIAVASVTILAVISPGADFAMITRNSIIYGRRAGLLSSFGIAAGVQLHVFYTMIGVGLLIRNTPELFDAIKLLGALYLIYVGYKTFFSSPNSIENSSSNSTKVDHKDTSNISNIKTNHIDNSTALKNGFFTNALNPKTTIFVLSVYTQIVNPQTSLPVQFMYGIFMSVAHWLWFSMVSLFLSEPHLRQKLLQHQVKVNRCIGLLLIALGLMLSLSST